MILPTPRSPLFPYTTLFRSQRRVRPFPRQNTRSNALALPGNRRLAGRAFSVRRTFSSVCENRTDSRRSEEHTSELQSRGHLVCRLLLEKKKKKTSHKNLSSI